jgi:TonB dependent receptor
VPGIAQNNVGDPSLTWEKNKAFNVGLDFGLLKDRIGGTLEYYKRTTSSLLAAVPFSLTSGFVSQNENVGSLYNKGVEITLLGKPVVTRDFTWAISFNITHNTNRVTSLYENKPVPSANFEYTVGHDVQEYYLQQWAGVNSATGAPQWYTDGTKKNITGDYDSANLALNHSASPTWYGGLTNTFTYKGLSLQVQFNYNFGNYIFDSWYNYLNSEGQYLGGLNQMTSQLRAWQKPGDKTDVPQIILGGNNNSNQPSTRWLYNGDFIRLRNIELSYTLPPGLVKKGHISNITIYVRGTNLGTFHTDKNLPYDPESGITSTANLEIFIPKTIAGGLHIGF